MSSVSQIGIILLSILYPPRCGICGVLGIPTGLCDTCISSLHSVPQPICTTCGQALGEKQRCSHCTLRTPAFVRARAMGAYEGTLRSAIHRLKFRNRPQIAVPLGLLLADFALQETAALNKLKFDAVIPVPIHPIRRRLRGYNQSERIANAAAGKLGLSVYSDVLIRTRNTHTQVGLHLNDRKANLNKAFAVPDPRRITGSSLLLVDDVSTTGSTLHECAQTLKTAGAKSVYALTLAAG